MLQMSNCAFVPNAEAGIVSRSMPRSGVRLFLAPAGQDIVVRTGGEGVCALDAMAREAGIVPVSTRYRSAVGIRRSVTQQPVQLQGRRALRVYGQ